MKTVCNIDHCAGCMACVDVCPKSAIEIVDHLHTYNAVIDEGKCVNCDLCHQVCQQNELPDLSPQQKWYQGWAADDAIRSRSSSGGVATALALSFVADGGVVCSCLFEKGEFKFQLADTEEAVLRSAGSKYVKSNPQGCYKKIKKLLQAEKKVLFIGLPCQAAAVKKYVGSKYSQNLYTVDLICHGTPSPKLLEQYLKETGTDLQTATKISFRDKILFRLAVMDSPVASPNLKDLYTLAFIKGISYTENCYSCHYAKAERVSDITLGDSWGSALEEAEQRKGISLILCQTEKGISLVESCDLKLLPVDLEEAIAGNDQLRHPSEKTNTRKTFFDGITAGRTFGATVAKCYPKEYYKLQAKHLLARIKGMAKAILRKDETL